MAIQLGDAQLNITGDASELEKTFAGTARKIGAGMAIAGAAITAALGVAVSKAADFGKGIGNIATLGVPNLNELKAGIMEVSQAIGVDLGDAAQATYDIISAGVEPAKAVEFLGQAAIAAKAGIGELGDAVDLGTTVMNAFGLSTKDTGLIFDQTQAAIKLGKTNIAELGSAVGKVAPLLKGAGVASEEMFAALAQLTGGGLSTAESVTGLRAVISGILKPTGDAEKLAKKLGIEWNSQGLAAQGLSGLMAELAEKTGGNIDAIGKFLPSVEAMPVAMRLMADGGGQLADKLDQVRNSTGESQDAFQRFIDANPAEKFDRLKVVVEVLAIKIGDALIPVLGLLVDKVIPVLVGISDWITANPKLSAGITIFVGVLGLLLTAIGALLLIMPGIVAALGLFSGAAGVAGATAAVAGGGGLIAALGGLLVALGPIAIALAAVGFLVFSLTKSVGSLNDALREQIESEKRLAEKTEEFRKRTGQTLEEANAKSAAIADEEIARTKAALERELGRAATLEEVLARMGEAEAKHQAIETESQRVNESKSAAVVSGAEAEIEAGRVRIGEVVVNGKTFVKWISKERAAAIDAEHEAVQSFKRRQAAMKNNVKIITGALSKMTDKTKETTLEISQAWNKLTPEVKQAIADMAGASVEGTDVIGKSWQQLTPEVQAQTTQIVNAMMKTSPFSRQSPSLVEQTQEGLGQMAAAWTQFAGFLEQKLGAMIAKIQQLSPFARQSPSLIDQTRSGTKIMLTTWTTYFGSLAVLNANMRREQRNTAEAVRFRVTDSLQIMASAWDRYAQFVHKATRKIRDDIEDTAFEPAFRNEFGGRNLPGAASGGRITKAGFIDVHRDERIFAPMGAGIQRGGALARPPQAGGGVNINITMPGMVIRETADIDMLNRGLWRRAKRELHGVGIQMGFSTAG